MTAVTLRVSEQLLREMLLRLNFRAEIVGAEVEPASGTIILTLDTLDLPQDVVEIQPHYHRSPGPNPVQLSGHSYRYADGRWEHPQPIEPTA